MAQSNKERLEEAFGVVQRGLVDFFEREYPGNTPKKMQALAKRMAGKSSVVFADKDLLVEAANRVGAKAGPDGRIEWGISTILRAIVENWDEAFASTLGNEPKAYLLELSNFEPRVETEKTFSSAVTTRLLDTMSMLLKAFRQDEPAEQILKIYQGLQKTILDEQARSKTRNQMPVTGAPTAGLKPWREVMIPHADVRSGKYLAAEFAADLAQVRRQEGSKEYTDPVEFYRRTFLTEGLKDLLTGALNRLMGNGGDPVVELQTNFGGGKTHSMLALYHLFSGVNANKLPGVDDLLANAKIKAVPIARRAVLVGTELSAAQGQKKADGTVIRTIWGELAWQLGEKTAFAYIAESDRLSVSPGAGVLTKMFAELGPCLILIDEWVAYARQLVDRNNLPAGDFESQTTFAQALTEAASAVPNVLVVASVPQSVIEMGGSNGIRATETLRNIFQRKGAQWRPASMEEGFEIVRRRLFEPINPDKVSDRTAVVSAFSRMYRDGETKGQFPETAGGEDYRRLLEVAYPIHPELFQRLYDDWSTLDKFQRTRGVLRLVANATHQLWENGDASLTIMPGSIPMEEGSVQNELVRYLDSPWQPIIAQDVDGENSVALQIDRENPTIGKVSGARRVARTLFIGTAPGARKERMGIDDRQVRLGVVQPGESVGDFSYALAKLVDKGRYTHQENSQYYLSTRPNLNRIADELAAAKWREPELLNRELERRLEKQAKARGNFAAVHVGPSTSQDIEDDNEVRLVVLSPKLSHTKGKTDSPGRQFVEDCLTHKGNAPRTNQNCLVFLAPDKTGLDHLHEAVASYLAWKDISEKHEAMNLDPHNRKQAEERCGDTSKTVDIKMPEIWNHILVPSRVSASNQQVAWEEFKPKGSGNIFERVSQRLQDDELLLVKMGPEALRMELDDPGKLNWAGGDHVRFGDLSSWYAQYLYLPRLAKLGVLEDAVANGPNRIDISDTFGVATSFDHKTKRYVGLVVGRVAGPIGKDTLLVKPGIALQQQARPPTPIVQVGGTSPQPPVPGQPGKPTPPLPPPQPTLPKVFVGSVELEVDRIIKAFGVINDEILAHLTSIEGAELTITVEIKATAPSGFPESTQRTVKENANSLKFTFKEFHKE
jgi:hypothetical protein